MSELRPSLDMLAAMDEPEQLLEEIIEIAESRLIVPSEHVARAWKVIAERVRAILGELRA